VGICSQRYVCLTASHYCQAQYQSSDEVLSSPLVPGATVPLSVSHGTRVTPCASTRQRESRARRESSREEIETRKFTLLPP